MAERRDVDVERGHAAQGLPRSVLNGPSVRWPSTWAAMSPVRTSHCWAGAGRCCLGVPGHDDDPSAGHEVAVVEFAVHRARRRFGDLPGQLGHEGFLGFGEDQVRAGGVAADHRGVGPARADLRPGLFREGRRGADVVVVPVGQHDARQVPRVVPPVAQGLDDEFEAVGLAGVDERDTGPVPPQREVGVAPAKRPRRRRAGPAMGSSSRHPREGVGDRAGAGEDSKRHL